MNKEETIKNYMEKLQLTREEAEELYEDDKSDEVLPEVAEMEKKAKSLGRRYENNKTTERKKSDRKPKIDEEKVEIISKVAKQLTADNITIVNPQREITFTVGANEYSLTLTKHRKAKE
jgi:hypothetical protein